MKSYSLQVRRYRKAVDKFFESQGANRQEMLELASWLDAYHKKEDEEKNDRLQRKLF